MLSMLPEKWYQSPSSEIPTKTGVNFSRSMFPDDAGRGLEETLYSGEHPRIKLVHSSFFCYPFSSMSVPSGRG